MSAPLLYLFRRQTFYSPTYPNIGDGSCDSDNPSCGPYPVVVLHEEDHHGLTLGAIVAIVVMIIFILLATLLVFWLLRRRRMGRAAGGIQNGGDVNGGTVYGGTGNGGGANRGFMARIFGRGRKGPTMSPTRDVTLDPEYRMHDRSSHEWSAHSVRSASAHSMTAAEEEK